MNKTYLANVLSKHENPEPLHRTFIVHHLFLSLSFVGNTEIDIDIKRYYCKAGIKSIQVRNVFRFFPLARASAWSLVKRSLTPVVLTYYHYSFCDLDLDLASMAVKVSAGRLTRSQWDKYFLTPLKDLHLTSWEDSPAPFTARQSVFVCVFVLVAACSWHLFVVSVEPSRQRERKTIRVPPWRRKLFARPRGRHLLLAGPFI